jgi:hypothetical protein
MEISGAIIVQVTRLESGLHIAGLDYRQNIHDRDATEPFLLLEGVTNADAVFKSFSFRRKPAGQHWFSYSHLLKQHHIKVDDAHKFRLLLEIPIREELPFVDFIPCGKLMRENGKVYIVFVLHTNASVQPTDHERMFFTHKGLDFLQSEPGLHTLVVDALEKNGIAQ